MSIGIHSSVTNIQNPIGQQGVNFNSSVGSFDGQNLSLPEQASLRGIALESTSHEIPHTPLADRKAQVYKNQQLTQSQ